MLATSLATSSAAGIMSSPALVEGSSRQRECEAKANASSSPTISLLRLILPVRFNGCNRSLALRLVDGVNVIRDKAFHFALAID